MTDLCEVAVKDTDGGKDSLLLVFLPQVQFEYLLNGILASLNIDDVLLAFLPLRALKV